MAVWFVRSNGDTAHNEPGSVGFVPGEPPDYPEKAFNYRLKCLEDGFARIGWPNTGDLRSPGSGRLAPRGYALDDLEPSTQSYLRHFSAICTGDLLLIPADAGEHAVHLGVAVRRHQLGKQSRLTLAPGLPAYFYHHHVALGEWYECAHRVAVLWAREADGHPAIVELSDLGGIYRRAFSAVREARDAASSAARSYGLLHRG